MIFLILPTGLVTTNSYDWKTQLVSSILYQRNATSGDNITVSYGYDNNGQVTSVTDGKSNAWSKTYDAMGRQVTLVTPNPGSGAKTWTMVYDGNSNITKTTDFTTTSHWYQYDALKRMMGRGIRPRPTTRRTPGTAAISSPVIRTRLGRQY